MQTFLPYESFHRTAQCLDYRRLGKQRIEAKQILQILLGQSRSTAWKNHPAVNMWRGYPAFLSLYGIVICNEWILRGYRDNQLPFFESIWEKYRYDEKYPRHLLGNEDFHASHRSNLLRKNYQYYSNFGWTESIDLEYVWPEDLA